MSTALSIKLLVAILAVLGVIVAVMVRHDRQTIQIDREQQKKVERMVQPPRTYLVP